MNVVVRGRGYIRVSKQTRNCCNIDTLLDRTGGKRVPNVVKTNVRQTKTVQYIAPVTAQMVRIHYTTDCIIDDEIISIRRALKKRFEPLILYGKQTLQYFRQIQISLRSIAFRRAEDKFRPLAILCRRINHHPAYGLCNMQRAAHRVVITPTCSTDFTQTHTAVQC